LGFGLVPIISEVAVGKILPVSPELGWAIGVATIILWLLGGVHFLIRPDDPGATNRIVASVIVFAASFVGFTWYVELPPRCISELPLEHSRRMETTTAQASASDLPTIYHASARTSERKASNAAAITTNAPLTANVNGNDVRLAVHPRRPDPSGIKPRTVIV